MLPRNMTLRTVLATTLLTATVAAQQQQVPGKAARLPVIPDCNLNGVNDFDEIAQGLAQDCNGNHVPDECDLGELTLLSESFENGLPAGWTATGLWHVTDQCPRPSTCDGTQWAYFGLDGNCTFDDFNFNGELTVPDIAVPAATTHVELSFCYAYEGEGKEPYDAADVRVNGQFIDHLSPEPQLDWAQRTIDLTAFAGQTISIEFRFQAMDIFGNAFLGWQVDNLLLTATGVGGPAIDCNANGLPDECEADCNANGVPDDCDIAAGTSTDCQVNGIPDECDTGRGASADCNLNLVPDECDVSISLVDTLTNLETASAVMTAYYLDSFEFTDGESGICIQDGGFDMYDCGNRLNTDLQTLIPYTGSEILSGAGTFGAGSRFFTAKYPGLFLMVATDVAIDRFEVSGFTGLNGLGTVDTREIAINEGGEPWQIYLKRSYDSFEPSINQIILVPSDGVGLTHTYSTDSNDCEQIVDGLTGVDRVYYALVSRRAGNMGLPLRPIDAEEIARELIGAIQAPASLDADDDGIPDECE